MKTIEIDDFKLTSAAEALLELYKKETKGFTDDELAMVIVLFMEEIL